MATNNAVNTSLSGQTGTGSFVGSTSPTLVTPVLGAASATSINFGGSSLSTNTASTSWTPVFTCVTPGNLSVSYTTQVGLYAQVGSIIIATFNISCTPTFSTASGFFRVTGLPVTSNATTNAILVGSASLSGTYNLGTATWVVTSIAPGTSYLSLFANQSNTSSSQFAIGTFTSGSPIGITGSIVYMQ